MIASFAFVLGCLAALLLMLSRGAFLLVFSPVIFRYNVVACAFSMPRLCV